jgi:SAM-dependent methyltransferase
MREEAVPGPDAAALARSLLKVVTGSWMTQATYVAAELRIADLLADGPRAVEDLAAATGTHAPSLRRLLRALVTIGVCRERGDGAFEITAMGSLLGTNVPGSLRSWAIWWGVHMWSAWGHLLYSVKTGESARKLFIGTDAFEQLERNPQMAEAFNQGLADLTRLTCEGVVQAYDFSGLKRIVDVGGGYGELLACILRASPAASGVLFELPHAIEGGRRRIEQEGLGHRCEFVVGSFFERVPSGADAYVLKNIVHDWDDDHSRLILENCLRAMAEDGRLLLVEEVLPDRMEASAAHRAIAQSDLNVLVALGGKERTKAEFRDLLDSAGFRMTQVLPVEATLSVIEAVPCANGLSNPVS